MSAGAVVRRFRILPLIALGGVVLALLPAGAANAALLPTIRINDTSVTEGNTGTVNAVFTIALNKRAVTPVSVDYQTVDGTATAGADYASKSGSVTFLSGEQNHTISIQVFGDSVPEVDETFQVTLSNPRGGTFVRKTGTGTILDDDNIPADLALTLTAPLTGVSGTEFVYTIAVHNNGPGIANDVIVADHLAAELSVQELTPGCTENLNDTVECDVTSLASGQTLTVTIGVIPNISGTFTNFAGAFANTSDPNPHNNFASASTIVTQP